MIVQAHEPINLCKLGWKRVTYPEADLETPWRTPYPIHTNYLLMCQDLGIEPYGGGDRNNQGERKNGYITSGYRDKVLGGNMNSPHFYAFAFDIVFINPDDQVEASLVAHNYFTRVGLYPLNGIIHVDLAPEVWIRRYAKARFWTKTARGYLYFESITEANRYVHEGRWIV